MGGYHIRDEINPDGRLVHSPQGKTNQFAHHVGFPSELLDIDGLANRHSLKRIEKLDGHTQLLFEELREVGQVRPAPCQENLGGHIPLLLAAVIAVGPRHLSRQAVQ